MALWRPGRSAWWLSGTSQTFLRFLPGAPFTVGGHVPSFRRGNASRQSKVRLQRAAQGVPRQQRTICQARFSSRATRGKIGSPFSRTAHLPNSTSSAKRRVIGSIYKGKVQNVLPGMGAAFVDIGLGRNAFLYVDDINKQPLNIGDVEITHGHSGFTIGEKVKKGDDVLVQIVKEPRGLKGARISTNISLARPLSDLDADRQVLRRFAQDRIGRRAQPPQSGDEAHSPRRHGDRRSNRGRGRERSRIDRRPRRADSHVARHSRNVQTRALAVAAAQGHEPDLQSGARFHHRRRRARADRRRRRVSQGPRVPAVARTAISRSRRALQLRPRSFRRFQGQRRAAEAHASRRSIFPRAVRS